MPTKMKAFALVLLACLASGCTTLEREPHAPFKDWSSSSQSRDEKLENYRAFAVTKNAGEYAEIDGRFYNLKEMSDYYEASGASRSAGLAALALAQEENGSKFRNYMMFGTGVTALSAGLVAFFHNNPNGGGGGPDEGLVDIVGGVLAVMLYGAGYVVGVIPGQIGANVQHRKAERTEWLAADVFNSQLVQKLKLDLGPQDNGAEMKIKVDF